MLLLLLLILPVLSVPITVYIIQTKQSRYIIATIIALTLLISFHYFIVAPWLYETNDIVRIISIYGVLITIGVIIALIIPNIETLGRAMKILSKK